MSKYKIAKLLISNSIILAYLICIVYFSGFRHEQSKLKSIFVTVFSIHLLTIIIADPIFYLLGTIYSSFRSQKTDLVVQIKNNLKYNQTKKLNDQLRYLKKKLLLCDEKYKNEKLNTKYRAVTTELWIFGKYFILIILIVVGFHEPLAYCNNNKMEALLLQNRKIGKTLYAIKTIAEIYDFIDETIIEISNDENFHNGKLIKEPGRLKNEMGEMLGVVRLRQVRYKTSKQSLHELVFDDRNFSPGWKLPYKRKIYLNRLWSIYEPWEATPLERYFNRSQNYADINNYANQMDYKSLLPRNVNNSRALVHFLRENNWLDEKTAAVFIEFTLYNIDSNLFTVCTISIEQTLFGSLIPRQDIYSARLHYNLAFISNWKLFIVFIYVLQFVKLIKHFVLKICYAFKTTFCWNLWDFCIITLNMVIIILILIRDYIVRKLMEKLDQSVKLHFVDFRPVAQMEIFCSIMFGILVCLTTIRLCKILEFSNLVRIFTATLSKTFFPLIWTTIIIIFFVKCFCYCIVNGNTYFLFNTVIKSMSTTISFDFGLKRQGKHYGPIRSIILLFLVAILLLNFFISVINELFVTEKVECPYQGNITLNYLQFLKVEYDYVSRWFAKFMNLFERNRSIKEKINNFIDFKLSKKPTKEFDMDAQIKRTKIVGEILKTQVEILRREVILRDLIDI